MNPTRADVLSVLKEMPGVSAARVARRLGVDRTTVSYHLRRLGREGLVSASGAPRTRRWFAAGAAIPAGERRALAAAQDAKPLLDALREAPGVTQSELARRLGVPRPTLAGRLVRLRREGLVSATRSGRLVLLHVTME